MSSNGNRKTRQAINVEDSAIGITGEYARPVRAPMSCVESHHANRDPHWHARNSDIPDDFAVLTGVVDLEHWPLRLILSEQPGHYATQERCLKLHDIVVSMEWRHRGVGGAALAAVCKYADSRQMALWLVVHGSGDDPEQQAHNTRRLMRWYRSYRFTAASEADVQRYHMGRSTPVMIRRPGASADDIIVTLPADVRAELAHRRAPVGLRPNRVRSATVGSRESA